VVLTDWRAMRKAHQERVDAWMAPHRARRARGERHPVYDFLFEYYSFPPARLRRWSPGAGVTLPIEPEETDHPRLFERNAEGCRLVVLPANRLGFAEWSLGYLRATGDREPLFHCHGLHEWAMVYRCPERRHAHVPLRLSMEAVASVVETLPLACTHYDAYRFFTPLAVPLNRHALSRESTGDFDQPGCIHVTMDLYKFAYKLAPWVGSEVLWETFELAVAAREVDMRASPYDLREWGFESIRIEEPEGRAAYVQAQRALWQRAQSTRTRLLRAISEVCGVQDRCPHILLQ